MTTVLPLPLQAGHIFSLPNFPASLYTSSRPVYPSRIFELIMSHHSGKLDLCLDLGCGPGNNTKFFKGLLKTVKGVDPSETMLALARERVAGVQFFRGNAEAVPDEISQTGEVDLIVSFNAVHWFPQFWWTEAERILAPRGTIALASYSGFLPEPIDHPEIEAAFSRIIQNLWDKVKDFRAEGNEVHQSLYTKLAQPDPALGLEVQNHLFHISDSRRFYDLSIPDDVKNDAEDTNDPRMLMTQDLSLDQLYDQLSTFGPFVRWQEVNSAKLQHEREIDIFDWVKREFAEAGISDIPGLRIRCSRAVGLTLVHRKKDSPAAA